MHSADSSLLIFRYFWNKKAKFGGFLFKIAICHKDLAKVVSKSRANYIQNWMYQWILLRILQILSYVSFISINIMPGLQWWGLCSLEIAYIRTMQLCQNHPMMLKDDLVLFSLFSRLEAKVHCGRKHGILIEKCQPHTNQNY